ncbi:MAG: hypothetical protein ACYSU1_02300 [Planctomycetota bacterium]|jgi:hypothetical protein
MKPSLLPVFAILGLGVSCAVPAMDAVRDLAAIHTAEDWRPQSPALLSASPEYYLGDLTSAADGFDTYVIEDHRQLEMAILQRVASVDVSDPARSIEVSSWMLVALSQDDYPAARSEAARILAQNAGNWILHENARLMPKSEDGNLAEALLTLDRAKTRGQFEVAMTEVSAATLPDRITGIRILTAIGRMVSDFSYSSGAGNEVPFSAALGIVLDGLEQGLQDPDPTVVETCRHWLDLLLPRATGPASR